MQRKGKIILAAHCVLNGAAKVEGLNTYGAMMDDLVDYLKGKGISIIQLPCPEMVVYGAQRWGHVREQLDHRSYRESCRSLLVPVIGQVESYLACGFDLVGVIGIDGSPTCGVHTTCSGAEWGGDFLYQSVTWKKVESMTMIDGQGILMQELGKMMAEADIELEYYAVNEGEYDFSVQTLLGRLDFDLQE